MLELLVKQKVKSHILKQHSIIAAHQNLGYLSHWQTTHRHHTRMVASSVRAMMLLKSHVGRKPFSAVPVIILQLLLFLRILKLFQQV